jgi:hypothetical protein
MNESPPPDQIAKALKGLTIAVWCLCALTFLQFAAYAAIYLRAFSGFRGSPAANIGRPPPRTAGPIPGEPIRGSSSFHDLPPDEMVKQASAILLTQWRKVDGEVKQIVTEILKHRPGTTLYYSVGDEYEPPGSRPQEYITGNGNVVFMEDSPASMRFSCSYSGERVASFGDMPLTKLRQLAREAK